VRPSGGLRLSTDKKRQEDLRSYNRAYKDLTVFLALHSQRSARSNAVLDDLHTTPLIAPSLSAVVKSLMSLSLEVRLRHE